MKNQSVCNLVYATIDQNKQKKFPNIITQLYYQCNKQIYIIQIQIQIKYLFIYLIKNIDLSFKDINLLGNNTSFRNSNEQFIYIKSNLLIMELAKIFLTEKAEKIYGKATMLGLFSLLGAYYFTAQIVPGIFLIKISF